MDKVIKGLKYIFVILFCFASVIPFLWIFLFSFKENSAILSNSFINTKFVFDGYINAFKIAPLALFYLNSFIVASISTFLNLLFVGMAAYVLARFDFRLKKLLLLLFSSSLFIPATALILPIYQLIKFLGIRDSLFGLILVYTALGLPVTLFVLRSYFINIPEGIAESAVMDGAHFLTIYFKIYIPLSIPALSTAGVLQFILAWKEFLFALVLTSSERTRTVPLSLNYFSSTFSYNYTAMFAAITVIAMPTIILFAIFQEKIVGSLVAGSIKG